MRFAIANMYKKIKSILGKMNNQVNCNDCKSLFVTHDQKEDGGCNYFGFKSKFIPSLSKKNNWHGMCLFFYKRK